jgi:DNA-directed RNA polymerase subunit omega
MDEAMVERLAKQVGGRFKLTSLVMKRLMEMQRGAQPLIEPESDSMLETALKEVELDLIRLVPQLPAPEEDEGLALTQGE